MTLGGRSYHANLCSTPARGTYPRFCSGNNTSARSPEFRVNNPYLSWPGIESPKFGNGELPCSRLATVATPLLNYTSLVGWHRERIRSG